MIIYQNDSLAIDSGDTWVFLGSSGSGKTALAREIAEAAEEATYIGFEAQEELIDEERERDETDFINEIDPGRSVREYLLQRKGADEGTVSRAVETFGLEALADQGLKFLSTGELRKTLLAAAVVEGKKILVLDDPFTSLDEEARSRLAILLETLHRKGAVLVFMLNRISEIPGYATHGAFLANGRTLIAGTREIIESVEFRQLYHMHRHVPDTLPGMTAADGEKREKKAESIIDLSDIHISYHDARTGVKTVFKNFSFEVKEGEHWKITGPNGIGKSTLLSLITGDHPQCYSNEVRLFGIKRGSGESIWDIKKHIGIVSSALQFDYRVRTNVVSVIISGFFDSIGVYAKHTPAQQALAGQWLRILGMEAAADTPYQELSFGQKRLVLIARAMVKHPRLLILDEPCQGIDAANRELVLKLVDIIASKGGTTVLYVTHHQEDAVPAIKKHLRLNASRCLGTEE